MPDVEIIPELWWLFAPPPGGSKFQRWPGAITAKLVYIRAKQGKAPRKLDHNLKTYTMDIGELCPHDSPNLAPTKTRHYKQKQKKERALT